jgi:hypothetical protein
MAIYTTSLRYASAVLPPELVTQLEPVEMVEPGLASLAETLFPGQTPIHAAPSDPFPGGISSCRSSPPPASTTVWWTW